MNILGIESTCDETGVALVNSGKRVLINTIASSVEFHNKFGGVVPEVAAREQVKVIIPLIEQTLLDINKSEIDAIAVGYGPGLIGSLLIGVETAKTLSYAWEKPLIAVNHLAGHFFANFIGRGTEIKFPAVGLIVSGGHTNILYFKNLKNYKVLGSTLDDAAGEAFDKIAKLLQLGYPGGPAIEKEGLKFRTRLVKERNPFPKPMIASDDFDFSFSGLKTAVVNFVEKNKDVSKKMISYFFQEAVVDILTTKTLKAARLYGAKSIVVGGGVAANKRLREKFEVWSDEIKIFFPEIKYSVDNGAMIAAAAYYQKNFVDPLKLNADSGLSL